MRVRIATALACVLALSACSRESRASNQPGARSSRTPEAAGGTASADRELEFSTFWNEFRAALLAGDETRLKSLTRFPLATRGPLDSDPVVAITSAGFPALLDRALAQDPGMREETDTLRAYVERTQTPPAKALGTSGATARVASFAFERVDGRWRLTMIYIDKPN